MKVLHQVIPWIGLLILIGLSTEGHYLLMDAYPHRTVLEDERYYVAQAGRHAKDDWTTLLPGNLDFGMRPPFFGHVLSRVAPRNAEIKAYAAIHHVDRKQAARQLYLRQARHLHILFNAAICLLLFLQARFLGLRGLTALVPPLLLCLLPRYVFHVHGIWSELLHMVLQLSAMTALIYGIRRRRVWLALPAGLGFGFAVLTRTTSLLYIPLAPLLFLAASYMRNRQGRLQERLLPGMAMSFLFVVAFCLVVIPQLYVNIDSALGPRLAANNWLNIHYALRPRADDSPEYIRDWQLASEARSERAVYYKNAQVKRELEARAQVRDFVDRRGFTSLVPRQVEMAWDVLSTGPSQFEQSLTRWVVGPDAARELRPFVRLDRVIWFASVVSGLLGMVVMFYRNSGWIMVTSYVGYYLVALCFAPVDARMAFQLAPFLCLATAGAWMAILMIPFKFAHAVMLEANKQRREIMARRAASLQQAEAERRAAEQAAAEAAAKQQAAEEAAANAQAAASEAQAEAT